LQWPLGTVDAKMPRVPVHFTVKFHYSTALLPLWPFSTPELSNEQVGYGRNRYRGYRRSATNSSMRKPPAKQRSYPDAEQCDSRRRSQQFDGLLDSRPIHL